MFGWNGIFWSVDEPQLRPALDQPGEREPRLELAEARARAVVDALAEREVSGGRSRARGSKRSGSGKTSASRPGRGEPEEELRALGQLDAAERRRARGDPPPHRHRGVEAQRLVDRAGDQLRVGDDRLPARAVLQQPPDQVADQVVRRLVAGEGEREQDRGDLLVAERLGVLVVDGEQRARVVVGARRRPCPRRARAGSRGRRPCCARARPAPRAPGGPTRASRASRTTSSAAASPPPGRP